MEADNDPDVPDVNTDNDQDNVEAEDDPNVPDINTDNHQDNFNMELDDTNSVEKIGRASCRERV